MRFLARYHKSLGAQTADNVCTAVLDLMTMPTLAPVFATPARAEMALAGKITLNDGQKLKVTGRVDRYIATGDNITLIDFKTGTPDPADAVSSAIYMQMAAYRDLVSRAKPGIDVRCGVVWTQNARLDWLAAPALDAAFDDICAGAFALS